uniref:PHD finger protein 21A-like isoform X3 n=1 Tax=Myxine glutinosa TaxID=7769 RepID=UPI00358EC0E3
MRGVFSSAVFDSPSKSPQKVVKMDLASLQEALKLEIQYHQNSELKKQLHDRQAKITVLSEKQKKVVEQLRKDLLTKQQASNAPKPAVMMVTSLSNGPKVPSTMSDLASVPINLQTTSKLLSENVVRILPKMPSQSQSALPLASSPIKVPQLSSVHRLTGRAPSTLPQVRPKPYSAVVSPVQATTQSSTTLTLQKPTTLLTVRSPLLSGAETTSPTHGRPLNGQPHAPRSIQSQLRTPGLASQPGTPSPSSASSSSSASSISSSSSSVSPGLVQLSATSALLNRESGSRQDGMVQEMVSCKHSTRMAVEKVTPRGYEPGMDNTMQLQHQNQSSTFAEPVTRLKKDENPEKVSFLGSLGLVTFDQLEEMQSRRQERKRRTTANPIYSGALFEPERKRSTITYLNNPVQPGTRKRGRPPKYASVLAGLPPPNQPVQQQPVSTGVASEQDRPNGLSSPRTSPAHTGSSPCPSTDGDIHEDFCSVCKRSGQLLMCDTCSRVYHLECLDPPLKNIPKGMWICPKCQEQALRKEDAFPWPGTLAIVHSYIAHKAAKEEEKRKLVKRSNELKQEREQLEQKAKQLSNVIMKCMDTRTALLTKQKEAQGTLDKIRKLIELVQEGHSSKFLPAPLTIPAASTPSSTPLLIITTLADPTTPGGLLAIPATPNASPAATVLAQIQAVPSSEPSH